MKYDSPQSWTEAKAKRVMLFGMSGLGKTWLANLLRGSDNWFHYSIDYRIGTRYMGEYIADNFKREAMRVPLLRELLLSDSIYVASNITFDNLAPLSTYLGKPGNPDKGGLPFDEYLRRQEQHRNAEIAALLDSVPFIERAQALYGYENFICDTGGSICEVVEPIAPMTQFFQISRRTCCPVWIEGNDEHTAELVRRFDRAPKPMYYQPAFLKAAWAEYLHDNNLQEHEVDPDAFVRWTYARALAHRRPRYAAMARRWGVSITAAEVGKVRDSKDFEALIATAIGRKSTPPLETSTKTP